MDSKRLEEGDGLFLDYRKLKKVGQASEAVLPVVVQDADTGQVLILAYANQAALRHALEHGVATFWSTSRDQLWIKGATSGDTLQLVEVRVNCEQNSLLYLVRPQGEGVCHTRDANGRSRRTCYYRKIADGKLVFVDDKASERTFDA
jgi:phosphoribosyl-AMP cyclohydrolase